MNKEFWKGRRCLITGHTGFKGGWLALILNNLGAEVIGYSLEPSTIPSFFDVTRLNKVINSHFGDIRDPLLVAEFIDKIRPSVVFHLAAQPLVSTAAAFPYETFEINVLGTANLLEEIRFINSVEAILVITSDKCYYNKDIYKSFIETDQLGGNEPYSASKAAAELVVESYRELFFKKGPFMATARAGNVLGGGDWTYDRIMPEIINSLVMKIPLKLHNPSYIRPWQYILDVLNGYLLLTEKLITDGKNYDSAWNFGPNLIDPLVTVEELVLLVAKEWGSSINYDTLNKRNLLESKVLKLNSEKALKYLNWKPKLSIEQTIKYTVDWYRAFYTGMNMYQYTCKQIETYNDF